MVKLTIISVKKQKLTTCLKKGDKCLTQQI